MMRKLSDLQIQELESFGYIVRSNEALENLDRKAKEVAKEQRPVSVKKPVKMVNDDEIKPDGVSEHLEQVEHVEHVENLEQDDDYSYLDELET
jgi:TPP-dependent 2-oxoacid decarboxylase